VENMRLKRQPKKRLAPAGFSMIELSIALAISMVMMVLAVPVMQQTVSRYRLDGAVSSVTGAIRATRYQAMMKGYRHRLAITPSAKTYQLSSMMPPAASYSNVGTAVPISKDAITISAATTLEFRPNGQVSATTGAMNLDIEYRGVTKTITVSTYGNVTVTP
jgi:Tfp pilus assembly protein FimT